MCNSDLRRRRYRRIVLSNSTATSADNTSVDLLYASRLDKADRPKEQE
jgi:hypothetical protein